MNPQKKPLIILFILAILVITVFVSCDKKKPKLEKVTVAQFGDVFLYMPLYIADDRGFFKEEGIDVDIISTGGDDKTFAAVLSGSAMFGVADPTFVAIAKEKGQQGKVIAAIVNGVPFWGVTYNKNIPEIKNSQELANYKVATFPSPSTAFTLQSQMFIEGGLKPNIKQAGFGTLLHLLEANEADIALELEPNISTAINNGAKIVYSMAEKYGDFSITAVTTSEETIKNNAELVQRFVNALQKAEKFAHNDPTKAIEIAKKRYPDVNPDVIDSAMRRIITSNTLPKNVFISASAWEKAIKLRKDAGEISSIESAASVLDMSFANEAIQRQDK